jgi:hypothetical protein
VSIAEPVLEEKTRIPIAKRIHKVMYPSVTEGSLAIALKKDLMATPMLLSMNHPLKLIMALGLAKHLLQEFNTVLANPLA